MNVRRSVKPMPNYPPSITIPPPMSTYLTAQATPAPSVPGATSGPGGEATSQPASRPDCVAGSAGCTCGGTYSSGCAAGLVCTHGTCLQSSCDIYRQAGCECGGGRVCADGGQCDSLVCHGSFDNTECVVGDAGCQCNGGTCSDPQLDCVDNKCRRSDCKPGTLSCKCTEHNECFLESSECALLPAGQFCVVRSMTSTDSQSSASHTFLHAMTLCALLFFQLFF